MSEVRLEKVWTSWVEASDGSDISVTEWDSTCVYPGFDVTVRDDDGFHSFSMTEDQFEAIKEAVNTLKGLRA